MAHHAAHGCEPQATLAPGWEGRDEARQKPPGPGRRVSKLTGSE